MKEYILEKINEEKYQYFIISLTYESILNYLNKIEKEKAIQKSKGILLIDQLLISGNNKNRFMSCEYENGKLKLYTAKNVVCKEKIRDISSRILKDEKKIIKESILPEYQKRLILEGKGV